MQGPVATRVKLAAATAMVLAVLPVAPARAHGPCACTFPEVGAVGTRVHIRSPAYRVIMNPRKRDFLIGPAGLESAYRPDAPTVTLLSRPRERPERRSSVRIPRGAPPGLYLLLIYDGSEAGQHYTWDYLHLLGKAPAARSPAPESGSDEILLVALTGGSVAFAGIAGLWIQRRRIRASRDG